MRRLGPLLLLAACVLLPACGGDDAPPGSDAALEEDTEALRAEMTARDFVAMRRRLQTEEGRDALALLALEDELLVQSALSLWVRDALEAPARLEEAASAYALLEQHFGGIGRYEEGTVPRRAILQALAETATSVAREAIAGPDPNPEAARKALEIGGRAAQGTGLPEVRDRWRTTSQWIELTAAPLRPHLAPHDGPRVVIVSDDFGLGEPQLLSVARRWADEGAVGGLRVGVLAIRRGEVRDGIRRRPAEPEEEDARIAARLTQGTVYLEPGRPGVGSARELGIPEDFIGILVFDREGRLTARAAAPALDPRILEPAVQRAASR